MYKKDLNLPNELSIKNFLQQHKADHPNVDLAEVEAEIASIAKMFMAVYPVPLRHKIAAHTDKGFKHTDFTNAYILDLKHIEGYVEVSKKLKAVFFAFANWAPDCYWHKILEQSKFAIEKVAAKPNI